MVITARTPKVFASGEHSPAARRGEQALSSLSGQQERGCHVKARKKGNAPRLLPVVRGCELSPWFVALLVCPGCLTHLIVLRFGDAFFEHLRTLAPSLGIFIFSEGVCCLASG